MASRPQVIIERPAWQTRMLAAPRRARKAARRFKRKAQKKGLLPRFGGLLNSWARRPSRPIAGALVVGGVATLLFTPLPNGDSWLGRLISGIKTLTPAEGSSSVNLANANPLSQDADGNNAISILGMQLVQNLPAAIPMFAGAAITAWLGRKFKI